MTIDASSGGKKVDRKRTAFILLGIALFAIVYFCPSRRQPWTPGEGLPAHP